jgi:hypothetical protein
MSEVQAMTFKELKEIVQQLENANVPDETKVMLDTGWDSLQEISPQSIQMKEARSFKVQDVLTEEFFGGYVLIEKAEKMNADGPIEQVIVIENLY